MPLCSRNRLFKDLWRDRKININEWMVRLLQTVQLGSADSFTRRDLVELSRSMLKNPSPTDQERQKAYLGKSPFPSSDPQLRIAASTALEDRDLFEKALSTTLCPSPLSFQFIGTAMCVFEIGNDHPT